MSDVNWLTQTHEP